MKDRRKSFDTHVVRVVGVHTLVSDTTDDRRQKIMEGDAVLHERNRQAAFQCVYDYLNETLSLEDRKILVFGTIFVEHVSCKVVRFEYLVRQPSISSQSKSKISLQSIGARESGLPSGPGIRAALPISVRG